MPFETGESKLRNQAGLCSSGDGEPVLACRALRISSSRNAPGGKQFGFSSQALRFLGSRPSRDWLICVIRRPSEWYSPS